MSLYTPAQHPQHGREEDGGDGVAAKCGWPTLLADIPTPLARQDAAHGACLHDAACMTAGPGPERCRGRMEAHAMVRQQCLLLLRGSVPSATLAMSYAWALLDL